MLKCAHCGFNHLEPRQRCRRCGEALSPQNNEPSDISMDAMSASDVTEPPRTAPSPTAPPVREWTVSDATAPDAEPAPEPPEEDDGETTGINSVMPAEETGEIFMAMLDPGDDMAEPPPEPPPDERTSPAEEPDILAPEPGGAREGVPPAEETSEALDEMFSRAVVPDPEPAPAAPAPDETSGSVELPWEENTSNTAVAVEDSETSIPDVSASMLDAVEEALSRGESEKREQQASAPAEPGPDPKPVSTAKPEAEEEDIYRSLMQTRPGVQMSLLDEASASASGEGSAERAMTGEQPEEDDDDFTEPPPPANDDTGTGWSRKGFTAPADSDDDSLIEIGAAKPAERRRAKSLVSEESFPSNTMPEMNRGIRAFRPGASMSAERLAELGLLFRRIGAGVFDLAVWAVLGAVLLTGAKALAGAGDFGGTFLEWSYLIGLPLLIMTAILALVYGSLFVSVTGGTPGMMLLGLRFVSEGGGRPSLNKSFAATAFYLLSLAPAGLGLLSVLRERGKGGFHTRLAGLTVRRLGRA